MKENNEVIYKLDLKGLDKNTVGHIEYLHLDWATVVYPQNTKNGKVYSHSAKLTDLEKQ